MDEIECTWQGAMAFQTEIGGHTLLMDAHSEVGGTDKGPVPKPLLLASLAGCTGMDVISILGKMREPVTWFNVRVQADMTNEHPKTYTSFTVIYEFKASDGLKEANVEKAVSLSQDRYCGVSALFRKAAELKHEIHYL